MIAAQDGDPLAEPDFQRDQEGDGLDGVVAPVDVVAHEEVVRVRRLAADLEQLHQVVKLTVDIATNRHRTLDLLHIGLLGQNLFGLKME